MHSFYKSFLISVLCSTLWSPVMKAQVYPAGFAQQSLGNGLLVQTASAFAPDGRIFVTEQTGRIRIIKNGAPLATAFATLTVDATGERGLLGIAIDPDYLTNKFIYVYHTVPAAGGAAPYNRVVKLNATNDVVSGSPVVLLNLEPLGAAIHNGGAMHFGLDKKLYIAVGENAKPSTAQDLTNYGGKLLRINTDGSPVADNPFIANANEKAKRVWAYGLRNPFTFAVDRETGKIFVNDVGQALWEEINDATVGGRNFGWPTTEGKFTQATYPNFTNPVYAYGHPANGGTTYTDGNGCAIVGGAFISTSNTNYPAEYRGKYLYQENCGNWINMLDLSSGTAVRSPFATAITNNSLGLTMGLDGLLYFSARHHQALYKIVYNNTSVPTITNQPANVSVAVGEPASFSVTALGAPPLTYQWQKNNVNIPGATSATYSIAKASLTDNGSYRVIVSNNTGSTATSNAATLTVISNSLPTAEILTPTAGTTYVAGTTLNFSGKATDPEDGAIPAASMTWQIHFHHDVHHHDEPPRTGIASGSFVIPQEGETSDNVWYRIILTVTDSEGGTGKDSVDILPKKSTITLTTNPAGLEFTVDGQPYSSPLTITSVEGILRTFGTTSPQVIDDAEYEFESWSNGGEIMQTLATPADDVELIANFSTVVGAEEDAARSKSLVLYPNPTREEVINIKISLKQPENLSIRLVNFLSQEIVSAKENLSPGEHNIPFHFGKRSEGIYSVIIKTSTETLIRKLVITE